MIFAFELESAGFRKIDRFRSTDSTTISLGGALYKNARFVK